MSIQTVVKLGSPQLSMPSLAIEEPIIYKNIQPLLADMEDTMRAKGGVGIAAPQIGYNKRIIMFGFDKSERYPNEKAVPFTILINPCVKVLSEELTEGWEGCLSVPGLRGLVPRYKKIEYSGYDPHGNFITRLAEGFHARLVQHEYDHIDGVLFVHRMKNLQTLGFEDELQKNPIYL